MLKDVAMKAAVRGESDKRKWFESLEFVLDYALKNQNSEQASFIVASLVERLKNSGVQVPPTSNTPYLNTIPAGDEPAYPGDWQMETRIKSYIRWNAMAMVVNANRKHNGLGGHISTYASSATLYEVAFNYFFRGGEDGRIADMVFFQGHATPGNYARAYLERRLDEKHLHNFRQDLAEGGGLSSYPHPYLMPDFWQFPTVSMGLGPLMSIYQARFNRYLQARGLAQYQPENEPRVWCYVGDGETDEPESLGQLALAARENLDNLVWVVNCNLQRLDGPVRGNGKIIQELEGVFRGAGWNVIKVIWGSDWDPLLEADTEGLLLKRMEETVDGEYQKYSVEPGSYIRKHFFGKYPELLKLVNHLTDDQLRKMYRGGHDSKKVYAAYKAATEHKGQPTVILAKTIKGYGLGEAGEGRNITHQQKKLNEKELREFRARFNIPISDEDIAETPFYRPAEDSPETKYLLERRKALGGFLPKRKVEAQPLNIPPLSAFASFLKGDGKREVSTTMAFVGLLSTLLRNKEIGQRIVPIIPDEARTFGMDGLFREIGIYSSKGQLYEPVDRESLLYYHEAKDGQILEEGINEAGSMASFAVAGTSYATHGLHMIPFYIYYSMFGFQRIGDLAWAAGDMQARGFLLGGTSGRTTLNGEGLQHEDGHSHILAGTIPNCISYDPTFAHEVGVILHHGMKRMVEQQDNVYFYITLLNENYPMPGLKPGTEQQIIKGMYLFEEGAKKTPRVNLLGSGTILRESMAARVLLEGDWGVAANVWSCPSFNELTRDGQDCERWNLLHPTAPEPRVPFVTQQLSGHVGPVIASTDYMKNYAEQIRAFIPKGRSFKVLGTDGFGRSDFRSKLREHFEVNRHYIVVAALKALADEGTVPLARVADAIARYGIDADKINPLYA